MELIIKNEQLKTLLDLVEQENRKKSSPTQNKEDTTSILRKNNSSNDFIIMIGGTPSNRYGAKWMEEQLSDLLSDKNVLYSDWENSVDKNINIIKSKYPSANITSVNGFSKGGLRAFPETGNFRFVGLIDPSIEGNYLSVLVRPDDRTFMIYKPNRGWGVATLKYAINKLGKSRSFPVDLGHSEMPREFVKRFKKEL